MTENNMSVAIESARQTVSDQREIVVFSKRKPHSHPVSAAGYTGHWVADFQTFRHLQASPCVFVVKSDNPNYAQFIVRQIRRDPENFAALVYVDGEINPADYQLTDGPLPDPATLVERVEEYFERQQMSTDLGDSMEPDTRLLKFMWLRPGYVLEPQKDWLHKRRYRYPIIEALDRTGSDSEIWINRLLEDRLIERAGFRDRLRECDYCESAHLDFIDVCTNCNGLDIERHQTLHCFTCGMVGPEERFIQRELRVCPKCKTRLRHIGTDYDRPVETHVCNECEHVFVEGEVIARCSICHHTMTTTQLKLRKIYAWRLSGLGRLAAQRGSAEKRQALFDSLNYANPDYFMNNLDWLLNITAENSKQTFSIFGLRLENIDVVRNSLGTKRATRLLDAFADRLHELLHDSDLGMRAEPETFYLLLPNADRKKLSHLRSSIKKLTEMTAQDNAADPNWLVTEIAVNDKNANVLNAESLIGRLRNSLGIEPDIGLS